MLTTVDNPFDPFTQWDEWFAWDAAAQYHTPGLLARITRQSADLSESDQHLAVQQAIDECVEINALGVLRKVKRGDIVVKASVGSSDDNDEVEEEMSQAETN